MASESESEKSDDDGDKSIFDRDAYQEFLSKMAATFLRQIKDTATKNILPPKSVDVSESSSTEVSSMRTTVTTLSFATE